MSAAQRIQPIVALAWVLCGCSDHTLVGNIYKSPDTGITADVIEDIEPVTEPEDTAEDSGGDTDTDTEDSGGGDTSDPGPDRLEGTLNLGEGDWEARRIGELTAFQPKIHLATADLNGDGAAEAVVGAPGWLEPADHGAVYISSGPISGDGLLAEDIRLEGSDRIQYAGFTVDVGTPADHDYPVLAVGSYVSVPDVFLVHGPITASGALSTADGSIQYTSPNGTAAWAGRDVSWLTHATDTWLLSGDPLTLDGRGAVRIHTGPFTGQLDQNGIGLIGGPTQGSFDNPPRLSCHTSTTDASGAPVIFAAAPGVSDSRGALFRVPMLGASADLPVELDDTEADNRVVGTAPGDMIGVFDDGWRCLLRTGDINGDGLDDVVVGAPHHNREAGMAWVLDGTVAWGGGSVTDSPALLATVPGDVPDEAETSSSCDGSCVGFGVELGDWDGDGAAELVVGRIRDFGSASLIWYGPVTGTLVPRTGETGSPDLMVKGSGTEMRFADGDADGDNDLFLAEGTKQYDETGALLGQGGVWMLTGE